MASTPSASALTSVLRCRGTLWTRNTPSKRSSPSAYGPALAAGPRPDVLGRRESFLSAFGLAVRYDSPPRLSRGGHSWRDGPRGVPQADVHPAAPRSLEASTGRPGVARRPAAGFVVTRILGPRQINVCLRDARAHPCEFWGVPGDGLEETPSFVEARWGTLRSTCRSLKLLLAHVVLRRLAVLYGCDRGRHRKIKRDESGQRISKNGLD
ncbi:uncharacterized protein LOC133501407 [Syngnathoides biaculeatus]|uniref:uncharacterized protein LOC133501407 n=1 Tax=Syngnathoides biaculeatus TaxID=300417 RepID=UPI002ADE50C7|nr:uncharacterized protein LOC133501407 [Syngnathoides biaculeatus]